ncbi:hypothetical protein BK662_12580 [Pseudomonas frederiksbergensis]|uniref:Transposase IS66 central domain-containing protein n=1 Tax=Pseudomonas frederiksbergensis TaxID=104087 RepID=A0A423HQX6_9PSED|nr:hypothetical protein BK662_12580 [Pseudomonas frederiksbergensis]
MRQKITDFTHLLCRQLRQHALDYSLKRWAALSRYLDDGAVPIENNWAENQIRPWALGRKNWLFAGSLHGLKFAVKTGRNLRWRDARPGIAVTHMARFMMSYAERLPRQ